MITERFKTVFGIDLRTLALFRVCLALLLIYDLINRSINLTAFFTDQGILPRTAAMELLSPTRFSLHLMNGSAEFQAILFIISGLFALALLAGYKTRLVIVVCWFLHVSLSSRNILLYQGGDTLLSVMLFWAMFLPLNARFSLDAALNKNSDKNSAPTTNQYFSVATLALCLQVIYVYVFGALLKTSPDWTSEWTAVYYALHLDSMATPLAIWIREYPLLMQGLTAFVWWLELLAPIFIFLPFFHLPVRLVTLFLLVCMHIGFITFLQISMFAFISLTSLSVYIPGWVWDKLGQKFNGTEKQAIKIYYDGSCEFCKKVSLIFREFCLPRSVPIIPAQSDEKIFAIMEEHDSWVVTDHTGQIYIKWQAVNFVLSQSPIFWPLAMILKLPFLAWPEEKLYDLIGRNRQKLGGVTANILPYGTINLDMSTFAKVIVMILTVMIFYLNLSFLKPLELSAPKWLKDTTIALNIYQRWSMFSPQPARSDGWFIIPGYLENGRQVDVFNLTYQKPTFDKPASAADYYTDYRWRKALNKLGARRNSKYRKYYGRYLCNAWNDRYPDRLEKLTLYFQRETTQPDYQPDIQKRFMLLKYTCPKNS